MEKDRSERAARNRGSQASSRIAELTAKEREVLALVAAGKTNREMAEHLGLSVRAIEDRRSCLMKKVQAGSIADLVRLFAEYQGASP